MLQHCDSSMSEVVRTGVCIINTKINVLFQKIIYLKILYNQFKVNLLDCINYKKRIRSRQVCG